MTGVSCNDQKRAKIDGDEKASSLHDLNSPCSTHGLLTNEVCGERRSDRKGSKVPYPVITKMYELVLILSGSVGSPEDVTFHIIGRYTY